MKQMWFILIATIAFFVLFLFVGFTSENKQKSHVLKKIENINPETLFKYTIDIEETKNRSLDEYQKCPPLCPERFRRKVKILWGIDINDYPKDALIWFGSDFKLSVTYQTIHGFLEPYDEHPLGIPTHTDDIYIDFRKYLFFNDLEAFNVLKEYTRNKYETDVEKKIDWENIEIDVMDVINMYDFLYMTYHSVIFGISPILINYVDEHAFYNSFYGLYCLPQNPEIKQYRISNTRADLLFIYISMELEKGRKFSSTYNTDRDIWLGFNIDLSQNYPSSNNILFRLVLKSVGHYPWKNYSVGRGVSIFLSSLLQLGHKIQNKLVIQYMSGQLDYGMGGSNAQIENEAIREEIRSNNYYGHAILREFCENPEREMPTLEKIGTSFKGMVHQPNTLLYLEPYPDSYDIDIIEPTETFKVYEMGYDDYYFVEVIKPVESPVAGPDGYAMILDRTETVYGYLLKEDVKEYTDAEILNNSPMIRQGKSKQGIINDPDGYVNIRIEMNSSAEILGKIEEKDVFNYWELPDSDWWMVQTVKGINGFVHKSRIKEKLETGGWIINEKE